MELKSLINNFFFIFITKLLIEPNGIEMDNDRYSIC